MNILWRQQRERIIRNKEELDILMKRKPATSVQPESSDYKKKAAAAREKSKKPVDNKILEIFVSSCSVLFWKLILLII